SLNTRACCPSSKNFCGARAVCAMVALTEWQDPLVAFVCFTQFSLPPIEFCQIPVDVYCVNAIHTRDFRTQLQSFQDIGFSFVKVSLRNLNFGCSFCYICDNSLVEIWKLLIHSHRLQSAALCTFVVIAPTQNLIEHAKTLQGLGC